MGSILLSRKIEGILSEHVPDKSQCIELTKRVLGAVAAFMSEALVIDQISAGYKVQAHRTRVHFKDSHDGFYVRRKAYRKEYRRHESLNRRVKSRSIDDYTVLDFLSEEWGDLIQTGKLTSSQIMEEDLTLYVAIRTYVNGVRKGTFGRPPMKGFTIRKVLKTKHLTIRKNPPWLR